jgi:phage gp46-like protein
MDFQIQLNQGTNTGALVFAKNQDIRTNIFLSLSINKGSFFQNKDFGCELFKIKKITGPNILLAQQYVQDALQWLIQTGRATSITVIVEQDLIDRNRLDIKISAIQPNGLIIKYTTKFYPVGGPAGTGVWTA